MAVETRVRFPVTAFPDVALLRRGKISPSWVRTSDLQVNSLTRYRLRHGGTAPRMQCSAQFVPNHPVVLLESARCQDRTDDLGIMRPTRYQLRYRGVNTILYA